MNKDFQGDVSQHAALYLKLIVNQNWTLAKNDSQTSHSQRPFSVANKENVGTYNAQQRTESISEADRQMLK